MVTSNHVPGNCLLSRVHVELSFLISIFWHPGRVASLCLSRWYHDSISCFVLNFQITNICFIMRATWKGKVSWAEETNGGDDSYQQHIKPCFPLSGQQSYPLNLWTFPQSPGLFQAWAPYISPLSAIDHRRHFLAVVIETIWFQSAEMWWMLQASGSIQGNIEAGKYHLPAVILLKELPLWL